MSHNLRNGKFLSLILGIVMVLGGLSACAQTSNNNGNNTTQNQGPIKIGISLSTSGDFEADGKAMTQGYQLWADAVNKNGGLLGRQVQLDIIADNSTPQQITTNYTTLITVHKDDLVFGPFSDLLTAPAAQVTHRYGYALVEGAGTAPTLYALNYNNIFAVSLPVEAYFVSFANYILSLPFAMRPKTAAYATAQDPFAQPQVDVARKLLEQGGIQTLAYTTYPDETTDFNPISQKVLLAHADMVVLGTLGLPDAHAFIAAFRTQHYNPSAAIFAAGPDQGDQFTKAVSLKSAQGVFVPNGGWFPGVKTFQNDTFTQAYLTRYGGSAADISSDTVQAYSVGQVLQQAVQKAQTINNANLITELHKDTFQSLQGPVQFDSQGKNTLAVAFLFQWQGAQLIPVYPSQSAKANPLFPKPAWS
ncbi:MAG TPA: amino acid ABC transporter substrate-binding protein [Ktedonobacteraceae bacterium]